MWYSLSLTLPVSEQEKKTFQLLLAPLTDYC